MGDGVEAAVDAAWALLSAGALTACRPAFEAALARIDDTRPDLRVRCWAGLGQLAAREGRWLAALTRLEDAARLARTAQVSPSAALIDLPVLHSALGAPAQSLAAAEEAVAVYRARGEWDRLVQVLTNRGHTRLQGGDPAAAAADFAAARDVLEAHGLPRYQRDVLTGLTQALSEVGDLDGARGALAALEAWMSAQEGESAYKRAHLSWARAHLRLAAGEPGALADAEVCLAAAEAGKMTREAQLAAQLAARAAASAGDYAKAWAHERRARELTEARFAAREADVRALQESRLRAAELEASRDEARAVAEARSWVLKVVSHELRTPLNGILGATGLLSERLSDPADRTLLSLVHTSSELMLSLVSSLLDAARLEAGALELSPAPVSLPALLEDTVAMLRPAAAEKSLSLSLHLGAGLPARLTLDAQRFQQIVLNLAANAVKFTPSGAVTVTASHRDATLTVVVDDDGPGVAEAERARIFAPFAQGEMGTTRRYGGAGLGLAISHQLASLFGGKITVHDAPGGGARFTLSIPAAAADDGPLPAPARTIRLGEAGPTVSPEAAQGVDVLLVDDDPMCRAVQQAMLKRLGARVRTVASGPQALEAVRSRAPDLVILDWMMPQMDGAEVAVRLRQRGYGAPILALTASPDPELAQLCVAAGIQAVYTKPVRLDTMADALQQWGVPRA